MDDWLAPVYLSQEVLVETTTLFSDCKTTNLAKQILTRTTSMSGLSDMAGTIAGAILRNKVDGESELYNAFVEMRDSQNCQS